MRFALLGPVAAERGGSVAGLSSTMPRTVLAVLLFNANAVVSTDKLTEALWGENPPTSAVASLQNHILRLRRMLGDEGAPRIRTVAPGYQIRVEPGELDLDRFAELCAAGHAAVGDRQWEAASTQLAAALALWRGVPAEDAPGLYGYGARIQELQEARLRALEGRIEADLHLGRHSEAIADLRTLTAEQPLREIFQEKDDRHGEAEVLNSTGALLAATAGPREALALHGQALDLAREINSPLEEARALEGMARVTEGAGDREAALVDLREVVGIYQRIGAAEAEAAATYLAELEDETRHDVPHQGPVPNESGHAQVSVA